jgi:hypothetical protein
MSHPPHLPLFDYPNNTLQGSRNIKCFARTLKRIKYLVFNSHNWSTRHNLEKNDEEESIKLFMLTFIGYDLLYACHPAGRMLYFFSSNTIIPSKMLLSAPQMELK